MPRNERMECGDRIERIRARFGLDKRNFAKAFGVTEGSYKGWVTGSGTSASTLKRGLVSLGVPDVDRALSWLADGEGPEPYWLDGTPGDPLPPSPPMVALPRETVAAIEEARALASAALTAGELRSERTVRVWTLLSSAKLVATPSPWNSRTPVVAA